MNPSDSAPGQPADDSESFLRDYFEGIHRDERESLAANEAANCPPEAAPLAERPASDEMTAPTSNDAFRASQANPTVDACSPDTLRRAAPAVDETVSSTTALAERRRDSHPLHLAASTLLSLVMVLGLLLAARLLVPSLVESIRYGWYRGQLRAEYELSGERLRNVSLDSLAEVSQLVSQRVGPSVVHINVLRDEETLNNFQALFGSQHPSLRLEGQGSGFVIDAAGFIMTNEHVVEGEGRIEVTLSDGRRLPAKIVGVDPMTDLAVLKVEASNLMSVDWGNSDDVVVGTPVWAAGSPFGLQQTVTFGIISGKHRVDFRGTRYEETVRGVTAYGDMMQSDVALNPGNSGGPLVNSLGEVVGVNAAILGETYRGVSFSIPSKVARRVAAALMEQGEVARGWLGVKMEDLADDERFDSQGNALPGVRIAHFPSGLPSPARQAGLEVGDIIIEFANEPVMNHIELQRLIGETEVGSTAQIAVLRQEKRMEYSVVLGKRDLR